VSRPAALAWSGGKDSTLALHRAVTAGTRVTHLFNIYEASSGRVRFHGVRKRLLERQAEALGLELVLEASGEGAPDSGDARADGEDSTPFERAFDRALGRLERAGVGIVLFGNIHLEDVRAWYEERTSARGFEHVEPLWGGDPARLAREFVTLGYRAVLVSVMLEAGDPAWLGRELDAALLREIRSRPDVDPCGEKGEFHSFAWDGPLFHRPVDFSRGETVEIQGHRLVDLVPQAGGGRGESPAEGADSASPTPP